MYITFTGTIPICIKSKVNLNYTTYRRHTHYNIHGTVEAFPVSTGEPKSLLTLHIISNCRLTGTPRFFSCVGRPVLS